MQEYTDFEIAEVPLENSNLVEASAGTGKTYSIAILVLRLILEKQISIREILMVTFTKAAVAELQERVRRFVREAWKFCNDEPVSDETIRETVISAMGTLGENSTTVMQTLKESVLYLDELPVYTIHGFCQQTLSEFSLEADQTFGSELIPSIRPIIDQEINQFWRKHITTLPVSVLRHLNPSALRADIVNIIQNHLAGKHYLHYNEAYDYQTDHSVTAHWDTLLSGAEKQGRELTEQALSYIRSSREEIAAICSSNRYMQASLLPHIENGQAFLDAARSKKDKGYFSKLPEALQQLIVAIEAHTESVSSEISRINRHLYGKAIREVTRGIEAVKQRANLIGYDDMISQLHRALKKENNGLLAGLLRRKYRAVFVDEFQDTDRMQYEIFREAFGTDTILFLIGDPKQSIYAWRKADISTYFEARNSVSALYTMNRNFRSTGRMTSAINSFLLPQPSFDTFHFGDAPDSETIQYRLADSGVGERKGTFRINREPDPPISIIRLPRKEAIHQAVCNQVATLLTSSSYSIGPEAENRNIIPSDIAILVRTNQEGRTIRDMLARKNIPAAMIDDSRIFASPEALSLLFLLEAMENPGRSTINRALLTPFTGITSDDLFRIDETATGALFHGYRDRWRNDGIYAALMEFITDFDLRNTDAGREAGERMLANLIQLTELLHQAQHFRSFAPRDLTGWLKRGIEGMEVDGDEYETRIDRDDDAVQIVTIHKSKGLQYNIVFAPNLDFTTNTRQGFVHFRNPETGAYFYAPAADLNSEMQDWYERQTEQENRRLIYVTLTRAVYKTYIFKNTYYRNSSLESFLQHTGSAPGNIKEDPPPAVAPALRNHRKAGHATPLPAPLSFELPGANWRKMSYTMLAAHPEPARKERARQLQDPYESFIFEKLRQGVHTGIVLHHIFENISFHDHSEWEPVIREVMRLYYPGRDSSFAESMLQMLHHVTQAVISVSGNPFRLCDLDPRQTLTELEFDFPVSRFTAAAIAGISPSGSEIRIRNFSDNPHPEGIMNGKIDLFFGHNGRYYVLDWKSNYLGFSEDDYNSERLQEAMNDSNYHLQYLIYTLAVKKYLKSRLPSFDYATQFGGVIYMFIRGVRANSQNGVFTCKPDEAQILALEALLNQNHAQST